MKKILVTAHEVQGTRPAKKGEIGDPWKLPAGRQITAAMAKSHGLDAETVEDLKNRGALVEVSARVDAEAGDEGALAEAIARAEAAEAKVADLQKQLADATKPAS